MKSWNVSRVGFWYGPIMDHLAYLVVGCASKGYAPSPSAQCQLLLGIGLKGIGFQKQYFQEEVLRGKLGPIIVFLFLLCGDPAAVILIEVAIAVQ